ncbi:precorrin-2 C(20)-methyltransferase [Acidimangrovimonas pyrenivorans]|uniref:Precorrin-2 C(20)-methyltransferase n=1 Tax=Acidimangrovimonas pyrenivorans TaxID=2030798 RepID=A0ABV7AIP3_9RHOB
MESVETDPVKTDAATAGRVICVGLGPGAPDLMSVRADRLVRGARHVAYFSKAGRRGHARTIVAGLLPGDAREYPMEYPVTTELPAGSAAYNRLLSTFYEGWSERIAAIARSEEIVVLCEGDPFFYGSFMHLHSRLQGRAEIEIVPGITGMSGCWTSTGQPITWGDDVLTVAMATLPEDELTRRVSDTDALVVMKIGRNLPKLKRALAAAGKLDRAWLIERGTMPGQKVSRLAEAEDVPYFSIAVIHGQGRRP